MEVKITTIICITILFIIAIVVGVPTFMKIKRMYTFPASLIRAKECVYDMPFNSNDYSQRNERVTWCYENSK